MFQQIRTSKFTRILCIYLIMMIFLETVQPYAAYALTSGPSQPEFSSFTPIGTSDMVDLSSGDFNYNIPIMDVGGYPINLAYDSGVTMDEEASWVGLGWNLNIGQINRNVRGLPDDFKGDEIETIQNLKPNVTVSAMTYVNPQAWAFLDNTIRLGAGLEVSYNNYKGLGANPSIGAGFNLSENVSLGVQLSASDENGTSISPKVSLNVIKENESKKNSFDGKISAGISYNSRQGLQNFNLSTSASLKQEVETDKCEVKTKQYSFSEGGSLSFNPTVFNPKKRTTFNNNQYSISFSFGPTVFGTQLEASISASATIQKIKYPRKIDKAFGYENSELATEQDIMDFDRENELTVFNNSTNVLPVTNYTYDILSIKSQGVTGQIRPYRGQTGYVFEAYASDQSSSTQAGAELEGGHGTHWGASLKNTTSTNYTGPWKTQASKQFVETPSNDLKYQKVYYKRVGENVKDNDKKTKIRDLFGANDPVTLKIDGLNARNIYVKKSAQGYNSNLVQASVFTNRNVKRQQREVINTSVQKITKDEAQKYGLAGKFVTVNNHAKPHHNAAFIITDDNGNRTVFGETAYNIEKKEITFATNSSNIDHARGLVTYNPGEDSNENRSGIDHYYNEIKTSQYAHTYLISSILSSDYQDVGNDGPSDRDYGSYTKFTYTNENDNSNWYRGDYKWRVPFGRTAFQASYNEGLKTDRKDQKASYLYGRKEMKYIRRIETKTHVAIFEYEGRSDSYGVQNQNGGQIDPNSQLPCLKRIKLYAKKRGIDFYPNNDVPATVTPIKTAHFDYIYKLCPNSDNSTGTNKAKLTLTKVYFTYQNSNLGKYTPYEFTYSEQNNPEYNPKNFDIWGHFKEKEFANNPSALTNQEFPYVKQDRDEQDRNARSWSLQQIKLPSGGKIQIKMESDDYKYVQNKRAMCMYKVEGVTGSINETPTNELYGTGYDAKYVVVRVEHPAETEEATISRYIDGLEGKPVYFDFFLNMTGGSSDHVTGYFEIDYNASQGVKPHYNPNNQLLYIPMKRIDQEGRTNGNNSCNPISVTGWFFGRQNLLRQIYDLPEFDEGTPNPVDMARSMINSFETIIEMFTGVNGRLKDLGRAKRFDPTKSWIRLTEPTGCKLGGGSRVKTILMFDEWNTMLENAEKITSDDAYLKKYGQEYNYKLSDNISSSGVATFEPNNSKENPLVTPFYNNPVKLATRAYSEFPFGSSFYPGATVTYSRVEVKNITSADTEDIENTEANETDRKTRSGSVVSTFYTSRDFPTITEYTPLGKSKHQNNSRPVDLINLALSSFTGINLKVVNEVAVSQGFQIETNDMNGKLKRQEVFDKSNKLISSVEHKYNVDPINSSKLNSTVTVIDEKGNVSEEPIGVDYDVVNDFRENVNKTETAGVNANFDFVPIPPFFAIFFAMGFFDYESHTQRMHAAVTTKVIHRSGILKETIATDLGAQATTRNLAWDANTGEILLTEVSNEYSDKFYNFKYPAYWHYENMGFASHNIDISGVLKHPTGSTEQNPIPYFSVEGITNNIDKIFKIGDEVYITEQENTDKVWVFGYDTDKKGVLLMRRNGRYVDECGTESKDYQFRIFRSGYRNNQKAKMAEITLMTNPLINGDFKNYNFTSQNTLNPKIVNASAIEYKDFWEPQYDGNFPIYPKYYQGGYTLIPDIEALTFPFNIGFNPFFYNYKGNWRAWKSYAYLTGRTALNPQVSKQNPRYNGFFASYTSYYKFDTATQKWIKSNAQNWTYASEVTKFSPYGIELENRDALNRYSAAQFDCRYNKPIAVASNSEYRELGFENFENHTTPSFDTSPISFCGVYNRFGFRKTQNVTITTQKSHSGRKSLKVDELTNGETSGLAELSLTHFSFAAIPVDCSTEEQPPCTNTIGACAYYSQLPIRYPAFNSPAVTLEANKLVCYIAFMGPDSQTLTLSNFCSDTQLSIVENPVAIQSPPFSPQLTPADFACVANENTPRAVYKILINHVSSTEEKTYHVKVGFNHCVNNEIQQVGVDFVVTAKGETFNAIPTSYCPNH